MVIISLKVSGKMKIFLKNRSLLTGKYDSSLKKKKTRKLVVGINFLLFMKALWEQGPLGVIFFIWKQTPLFNLVLSFH